jgi:hypothetical protein
MYGGMQVRLHGLLTSVLHGGDCSAALRSGRFDCEERAPPSIRPEVRKRPAGFEAVQERKMYFPGYVIQIPLKTLCVCGGGGGWLYVMEASSEFKTNGGATK